MYPRQDKNKKKQVRCQQLLLEQGLVMGPSSDIPWLPQMFCLHPNLVALAGFQGHWSGSPADPWDDADLSLYKVTNILGFFAVRHLDTPSPSTLGKVAICQITSGGRTLQPSSGPPALMAIWDQGPH